MQMTRRDLLAAASATIGTAALPAFAAPRADDVFLLSYFTDKDEGRAGLKLARSDDGFVFSPLGGGRGFLTPEVGKDKLMRDPHITRGPDGTYHMVWTSSWTDPVIGHATSKDLVNWSGQQSIAPMTHEPTARNVWAPETFYDEASETTIVEIDMSRAPTDIGSTKPIGASTPAASGTDSRL